MKLLTRINRSFLITAVTLLTIWSIVFYFSLRSVIHSQSDENLLDEKDEIIQTFHKTGKHPVSQTIAGELIEVRQTDASENIERELRDTMILEPLDQEIDPYRILTFTLEGKNENFVVTIGESNFETEDLTSVILIFILLFVIALFTVLYLINRRTSKNIWLPFNDTLEKLKSFDLAGQSKISFAAADIAEFEELNQSLNVMTERIYSDYSRLKQFTENASHEIQTPLSIIRSKIETLIQSENISEEQMNSIQKINEAVSRLSKLNSALLTITKIENYQFTNVEEIHLASFIRNKLAMLEEIIQQKKITVTLRADEEVYVKMNTALADLLFDNLIGNAIKHNIGNGFINISIQRNQFTISNSGEPLTVPGEKLFDRFVKNDPSSDSLGLGLAMVKQICVSYGFDIHFSSEKDSHTLVISF